MNSSFADWRYVTNPQDEVIKAYQVMTVVKESKKVWNTDEWKYHVICEWVEIVGHDPKAIELIGRFQEDWIVSFEDTQEYGKPSKYKYLFRDEQKAILFALKYC